MMVNQKGMLSNTFAFLSLQKNLVNHEKCFLTQKSNFFTAKNSTFQRSSRRNWKKAAFYTLKKCMNVFSQNDCIYRTNFKLDSVANKWKQKSTAIYQNNPFCEWTLNEAVWRRNAMSVRQISSIPFQLVWETSFNNRNWIKEAAVKV